MVPPFAKRLPGFVRFVVYAARLTHPVSETLFGQQVKQNQLEGDPVAIREGASLRRPPLQSLLEKVAT